MSAHCSGLIETYRGAVYPWHCDHMDHMNVMWYVGKFDEATWNLFAAMGVTAAFLKENQRGMAAVQQNITYRRELLAGWTDGDIPRADFLCGRRAPNAVRRPLRQRGDADEHGQHDRERENPTRSH